MIGKKWISIANNPTLQDFTLERKFEKHIGRLNDILQNDKTLDIDQRKEIQQRSIDELEYLIEKIAFLICYNPIIRNENLIKVVKNISQYLQKKSINSNKEFHCVMNGLMANNFIAKDKPLGLLDHYYQETLVLLKSPEKWACYKGDIV